MVTATEVAAFQVPAVLAKPVPQGGPAGWGQRVSANADHTTAAISASLAVLEEEVHAATWPVLRAGTVTQQARSAYPPRQLIQQQVEMIGVRRLTVGRDAWPRVVLAGCCPGNRVRGPVARGASADDIACSHLARPRLLIRNRDGQRPDSIDGEPKRAPGPCRAYAADRHGSSQRRRMGHRAPCHLAPADLSNPVPGLSITQAAHACYVDYRRTSAGGGLERSVYIVQVRRPVPVVLRCHHPSLVIPSTRGTVLRRVRQGRRSPSVSALPMAR